MKVYKVLIVAFLLGGLVNLQVKAQQYIPINVGSHSIMDSSEVSSYGYYFVAQSCFRITGVRLPFEVDSIPGVIQLVMLDTVPPNGLNGTNEFEELEYFSSISDTNIIATDLVVSTGDVIGVLGGGVSEQMIHSMHIGTHSASINGSMVNFNRLVYDGDLGSGAAQQGLYTEANSLGYSRVELYYDTDTDINADFIVDVDFTEVSFYDDSNGGETYLWDFGDGNGSTSQDPVHDYGQIGTYIVALTVTDICGSDVHIDTVNVISLSVDEEERFEMGATIYPNPTDGRIIVTADNDKRVQVKVTNIMGQPIIWQRMDKGICEIDMAGYAPGLYFIQIGAHRAQRIVLTE